MKKMLSLAAMFAALSYASPAFAETNINVYGTLDAAIGDVTHSLSVDPNFPGSVNPVTPVKKTVPNAVIGIFNGGISDSRIGVKGTTDICDGMKVFYTLEEGFNLPTGKVNDASAYLANNSWPNVPTTAGAASSLSGQLFNRQAFVGISEKDWGSLAVGRNYAPIFDIAVTYDPVQDAQLFSPFGYSGAYGGGGGVTEDCRVDNSLKYSNKIGSFNFGALYKFGGTAGEASAKSAYALNAGFEEGNFGIQGAYQAFNDAIAGSLNTTGIVGTTTPNSIAVTNENTKAWMVAAKYKVGAATLKVGYQQYTISNPSDNLTLSQIGNYFGHAIVAPATGVNFSGSDRSTHIVFGGGDYNFSDKFNLAAGIYDICPQKSDDNGQKSGGQLYLSLLADYHITKTLDTYAGLMYASFSGSQYPETTYYQTNCISAVGLRYKF
ncbi:MAG: porin [Chlorobiales bacterium]|nr:porin [Chlorobiales bacterium]